VLSSLSLILFFSHSYYVQTFLLPISVASFKYCLLCSKHARRTSYHSNHILSLQALLADLEDLRNPTDNATTNSDLKSGKELASDVSSTNEGHARLAPEVLRAYFELMDTDGDGEISRQEFLNFARKTGLRNLLD
jgi:hypothetical protein